MKVITAALLLSLLGAGPATQPASRPAKERHALMNGAVRFMVPGGWKETLRDAPDQNAQYDSPDGKAKIIIGVSPQQGYFPKDNDAFIAQMKSAIIKGMTAQLKERGDKVLYGPRSESDDRFLVRIHTRVVREGETYDEVQTYRTKGLDMLMVLTQVKTADPNEAKPFFEMGEDTCLSIILGPADKKKPATKPRGKSSP